MMVLQISDLPWCMKQKLHKPKNKATDKLKYDVSYAYKTLCL